jgi:hypothetical protein
MKMANTPSPNFKFLAKVDPVIVELAAYAERHVFTDPASIIGFIRHLMLDTPLVEFEQRVDLAMENIRTEFEWNSEQLKWLDRIESQIRLETIVDRESLNEGQFKTKGGSDRINKVFWRKTGNRSRPNRQRYLEYGGMIFLNPLFTSN